MHNRRVVIALSSLLWVTFAACGSGGPGSQPTAGDTTAPSVPSAVVATALSQSEIRVAWAASTDDVGVAGYRVYAEGSLAGETAALEHVDAGLAPSTTRCYEVSAYDQAGNESARAPETCASTLDPSVVTSVVVAITSLPTTSTTGGYTVQWGCSSAVCTNAFTLQEAPDTSFASPQSYYFTSGETSKSFTGKADGTYCYRIAATGEVDWSAPACVTVAAPSVATLRIVNDTHYDVVTANLNDTDVVYYPYGIQVGSSADFSFSGSGTVDYYIAVGFYGDDHYPDEWFYWSGSTSVTLGSTQTLTLQNPSIAQILSGFASSATWAGDYWDASYTYHYKSYVFTSSGGWTLYDDGAYVSSGTVSLVSWPDYASIIEFKHCSTCEVIQTPFPFASFYQQNGPSSWSVIQYVIQ